MSRCLAEEVMRRLRNFYVHGSCSRTAEEANNGWRECLSLNGGMEVWRHVKRVAGARKVVDVGMDDEGAPATGRDLVPSSLFAGELASTSPNVHVTLMLRF